MCFCQAVGNPPLLTTNMHCIHAPFRSTTGTCITHDPMGRISVDCMWTWRCMPWSLPPWCRHAIDDMARDNPRCRLTSCGCAKGWDLALL
jgi:hypothetical protein